jgi:hypothetical protein
MIPSNVWKPLNRTNLKQKGREDNIEIDLKEIGPYVM